MKLLLDTHTFLWLMGTPKKLSARALEACQDPENELFLSLVSIWEIQIKMQLGKLEVEAPLREIVRDQQAENGLRLLTIGLEHILALSDLPLHHNDPFDRLLIAQSRLEDALLVTADEAIREYEDVQVLW